MAESVPEVKEARLHSYETTFVLSRISRVLFGNVEALAAASACFSCIGAWHKRLYTI
jgi:hypothetical protein